MRKYLLLALLLTGCDEIDNNKYEEAHKIAEKSKLTDNRLGFGFKADMTRKAVEEKLGIMKSMDKYISLPNNSGVLGQKIEPEFSHDTLAELTVHLLMMKEPDLESLKTMLGQRYGQQGFKHRGVGEDAQVSWFNGPIEIQLNSLEIGREYMVYISYMDLRRYDGYLQESTDKYLKEQSEAAKKQAAEAQKL